MAGKVKRGIIKVQRWVRANERLLIVAASSCIMSVSHTALRPVLPVFAKVRCSLTACILPDIHVTACTASAKYVVLTFL